ncbi:MAG: hypothetical protein NT005_17340, partial [Spirochaetes bacterium]|nr:hypothetical protein [Spirochaetota bacterium]
MSADRARSGRPHSPGASWRAGRRDSTSTGISRTDRRKLLADPYFFEKADRDPSRPFLVILDEIHKHPRWKNYLKGAYDG